MKYPEMNKAEVLQYIGGCDRLEFSFLRRSGLRRTVYSKPWAASSSFQRSGPALYAWNKGPIISLEGVQAVGNARALIAHIPAYFKGCLPQTGAGLMLEDGLSFQYVDPDGTWDGDTVCRIRWDELEQDPQLLVQIANNHGKKVIARTVYHGGTAWDMMAALPAELETRLAASQLKQAKLERGED